MPKYRPTPDEFRDLGFREEQAAHAGEERCGYIPVYRQLTGDGLTPVSAFKKLAHSGPSFLFESVIGGEKVGRYSFLGTAPFLRFEARGHRVGIHEDGLEPRAFFSDDPFGALQELVERYRAIHLPGLPRFSAGAVGYASYDSVRYTERLPAIPPDDRGLPDLAFNFYKQMVIFDHIRKTVLVVSLVCFSPEWKRSYDDACHAIDTIVNILSEPGPDLPPVDIDTDGPVTLTPESNFTQEAYEDVVRRCQEYIKAGDIFQVVPSQRFKVETTADPFDIYRVLRVVNPSPFLFYLPFDDFCLIGSSPEILVRVEDGTVTIRPLAGTRRRGKDEAEDAALAAELLADPKERAEHIMLVDLGRNDVGRVAVPSSVELSDVMKVERYSHVMHITSNVTGRLAPGLTAFDALRAGLPAGTVSGAPKVRAMQIIDEMEPQRRGPYGGAVGYIDFTGNMDTCIALRTLVLQGTSAYVQAGGGVVLRQRPRRRVRGDAQQGPGPAEGHRDRPDPALTPDHGAGAMPAESTAARPGLRAEVHQRRPPGIFRIQHRPAGYFAGLDSTTTSPSHRRTSPASIPPASQTSAFATAQAIPRRRIASGSSFASQPSTSPARRQSPEPIGLTGSIAGGVAPPVVAAAQGEDGPGAIGDDGEGDAPAYPAAEQGEQVGLGGRGPAEVGGGLAAVELDDVRPEPPDPRERRAVGVQEDRHAPGAGQGDQVGVKLVGRRRGAGAREGQGLDILGDHRPLDPVVQGLRLLGGDRRVGVEEGGGRRIVPGGADGQDDARGGVGRRDEGVEPVVAA